jgi:hypothetical protein
VEKYFVIKKVNGYDEFMQEFETKEQMLKDLEEFCRYDGNSVRIVKGKELKLIKKEIVVKYDVEEKYRAPKVNVRIWD